MRVRVRVGVGVRLVPEVEDELRAVVDPLALGGDHALALARRVVEEARGHLVRVRVGVGVGVRVVGSCRRNYKSP